MVVDFDGRALAKALEGHGEKIVLASIDISASGHERDSRKGHHMLAHLRTEAYPAYSRHIYPPKSGGTGEGLTYETNNDLIEAAKRELAE
jgi:hypothetical protein